VLVYLAALPYFYTLSKKTAQLPKKKLLRIKFVFWFSLPFLPETLLILRRIRRDMIINVHKYSCRETLFLSYFNEI